MDEEDCVQYWIYPTDDKMDELNVLAEIWNVVEQSVNKYLWHQQMFNLAIKKNKDCWYLYGKVNYGESINDEWMVVALLKYITSKLSNVVAKVEDSDGEILLIEAAEFLPKWAGEPEVADGRVFLFDGNIHLLQPANNPSDLTPFPSGIPDGHGAASFISKYPHLSVADNKVQKCIATRLGKFPEDVTENIHTTNILLPDSVAAVLTADPQNVCSLIISLGDKDHIDLRKCRTMPRIRPDARKMYSVNFPKCLYAMLSSFDLRPHRSSGWNVDEKNGSDLLGYKLSLGLEILASRYRSAEAQHHTSPAWTNFISKLKDVGYFQGEMEGSKKYQELCGKANAFFQNCTEDDYHSRIDNIMSTLNKFEQKEILAPETGWLSPAGHQDSLDWMEVTPESLDKMLAARFGVAKGNQEKIPDQLNNFLKKISDMAGVEIKDDDEVGDMKLQADDLVTAMNKLLGPGAGEDCENFDDDVDSSDDDDDQGDQDPVILDYMSRLDAEVGGEVAGRSDLPDLERPLEVDSNVLSNLLSSYSAELGYGGPASSILNTIGINPGEKKHE
jgi:hypothetical protein